MGQKKIIFTGGGTVGHVTLNLILMPKFIADGWQVHYIGDKKGVEYQEIVKSGLPVTFHGIATGKLRRYFSWQNFLDLFKVAYGIIQSLLIVGKVRPQALFSKGGFVSVPPVIAARLLRVPVFVHESDLSMGLANKIASKFATTMYTTFKQGHLVKEKHVGAITKISQQEVDLGQVQDIQAQFDDKLQTILFIGGSGGAKVFNDFISNNKALLEAYNVINISGDKSLNQLSQNLYRVDYVTDSYQALMTLADVVVTRGGANTIFELLAMKKLQVIVPLGKEASRGDQLENAAYFEKQGYAKQILESDLTMETLNQAIKELLANREAYISAMEQTKDLKSADAFYALLQSDIEKT
ncbi:UDP-N-acetylglucosamine--N-acetylmuramyl-(pentapeptide) pyrophosphoryl-undecaprenol N-acetylglucosamine transferase [Streptococcus cuniculipharyngis]|uniref:UDP-N-acetylglucosamine--N-acetylmuramyl-(pentapeptide) pyrophosphoryl-undecaprenol N-acetylglucosamine transferase n=1 Tax=Streptococcus cuniculipharyngis TaxID=1562651 RepID=A0A5C5SBM0_9STRE|nr:UDP-N-acetylglucosamine--N-acetylmuramyl-(pentapeptide) pyrophosphoryl-undecaprenol N-acetylglucosamine transferase [Streptococcus cuniculipharyngis]TWS96922.1 UDP-N-acetylglucosamine--N-acetylmuramyl-(pentapeptide) pyrophosphoryl-undecaprenol N-acetylglucosamine transferase [Streptococcus cuniculipharyngis]